MSILPAGDGLGRPAAPADQISLVDLLDRLLATGVVLTGRVRLSIADVDLVDVSLNALLSSVHSDAPPRDSAGDQE